MFDFSFVIFETCLGAAGGKENCMIRLKTRADEEKLAKQLAVFKADNEEEAIALGDYAQELARRVHNGEKMLKPLLSYISSILMGYNKTLPKPRCSGADMLRFMMGQCGHRQKDLAPVMSRSAVSAVLNGRRELTAPQMRRLGKFYNMDPALFMGRE